MLDNEDLTYNLNKFEFVGNYLEVSDYSEDVLISINIGEMKREIVYIVPYAYHIFDLLPSWYMPFYINNRKVYLDGTY